MGTFLKTFIICLIVCLGFIFYNTTNTDSVVSNFSQNSFLKSNAPTNKISNKNKVKNQDDFKKENIKDSAPSDVSVQMPQKEITNNTLNKDEYIHTCYFYSADGKLVPYRKKLMGQRTIEKAIIMLLKGPLLTDKKLHSEIPPGTDLIYVKKQDDKLIVNLSNRFADGGGSQSIENRVRQLTRTIKDIDPKSKIYLYINGKEVEYMGGDGVYIKQPLEL